MAGFDIRDIAEIIPFIKDNLSNCAFIIMLSVLLGFFIGKLVYNYKNKNKINNLEKELESAKKELSSIESNKMIGLFPISQFEKLVESNDKNMELENIIKIRMYDKD